MRALVLSGGGPLATAWEAGLLAGFARAGLTFADADFVLGTSAGAIVGAHVAANAGVDALFDRILAEEGGILPAGAGGPPPQGMAKLPELFLQGQSATDANPTARAEVGAYALGATTEAEDDYVARVAHELGVTDWPATALGCVAVNARTGEAVILDRRCGADLARAVAASCSLPGVTPPVIIGGAPYMDGGLRSTANADLLTGYDKVLVIAFATGGAAGVRMRARAAEQAQVLREAGARVQLITPDEAIQDALGPVPGDVMRRPAVARAAGGHGEKLAAEALRFWRGAEP